MILCPMMASPSSWDIMGDTDDLFYDAARNRVYVPGARTGLFVPDGGSSLLPYRIAETSAPRSSSTKRISLVWIGFDTWLPLAF